MSAQREPSLKGYLAVWAASLVLLLTTAGSAYLELGPFNTVVSLSVALAMLLLQMLFYMRLRYRSGLLRVFAFSGFFFLAIMIGLSLTDYLTRTPVPPPW